MISAAEQEIIGIASTHPGITQEVHLTGSDFDDPKPGMLWDAISALAERKVSVHPATILDINPNIDADTLGLLTTVYNTGIPTGVADLADIIRAASYRRRLDSALALARQDLAEGADPSKALAAIDAVEQPGAPREKPTGFLDFVNQQLPATQWVIPGLLAREDRLVLTAEEGVGKALALDTRIPTPTGWTTMREIHAGDLVLGDDGKPVNVSMATEVMTGHRCYRVEFSDGSSVVADADHRWMTSTLKAREAASKLRRRHDLRPRGTDQRWKMARPEVVTTEQIRGTLKARDGHCLNHSIPTTAPLDLPEAELPIDPYTLGAWLGDGTTLHAEITTHPDDVEILDEIRKAGYTVDRMRGTYQWSITRREQRDQAKKNAAELIAAGMSARRAYSTVGIDRRKNMIGTPVVSFSEELRSAGLLGNKHIPEVYLRSSHAQRLALLRGLMDTDGTISASGLCEFSVCDFQLARGFHELLMTLGIKATFREDAAKLYGRTVGTRYRIVFYPNVNPFALARKASRVADRPTVRGSIRYIKSVEEVESVPVRCIQVDNPQHMYLCGDAMIPTHNSHLLRQIAVCAAAGIHPFTGDKAPVRNVLYLDLENGLPVMMRTFGDLRRRLHITSDIPLHIWRHQAGYNLARTGDRLEIRSLIADTLPDLVIGGPIYRMYLDDGRLTSEAAARVATAALDDLRAEFGFALALEHHAPHRQGGFATRDLRPIGSSLWLRWPEFGLGMAKAEGFSSDHRIVNLMHWRGDREERHWPPMLEQGTVLPWIGLDRDGGIVRAA